MNNSHQRLLDQHLIFAETATDRALILVDQDGTITSWNRGAELLTGWLPAMMIGETVDRLYSPEDQVAGAVQRDRDLALQARHLRKEVWLRRRDGSEFLAALNIAALIDGEGRSHGFGY